METNQSVPCSLQQITLLFSSNWSDAEEEDDGVMKTTLNLLLGMKDFSTIQRLNTLKSL